MFVYDLIDFLIIVHHYDILIVNHLLIDEFHRLFHFLVELTNLKFPMKNKMHKEELEGKHHDTFLKESFFILYCLVCSC